jgi:predicted  nucleic acid-binding Zn-ribbon protein
MTEARTSGQWTRRRRALASGVGCVALAAGLWMGLPSTQAVAQDKPAAGKVSTNILAKIYDSGYARMSRGDVNGAVSAYQTVADIAPEVGEANYQLALAMVLADFAKREQALPVIARAQSADPSNPVTSVIAAFANPALTQLRPDGALYLSREAAERVRVAAGQVQGYSSARNGRFLAAFLGSAENTNDPAWPARFVGFNKAIGQGGKLRLPQWSSDLDFAQLFAVSVADAKLAPFEPRLIARLQDGLNSLQANQGSLTRIRGRIGQLRQQLTSTDPTERLSALANLDKVLAELDDVIVQNETQIAQLKTIVDNVKIDDQIAKKKEELKQQEAKIAEAKQQNVVLQKTLVAAKDSLQTTEKQRLAKIKEVNDAQKQLNAVQARLAQAEAKLSDSNVTANAAEKAVKDRTVELAQLQVREDALKQAQEAAKKLEQLKQEQDQAASQLAAVQEQVRQAQSSQSSTKGNLAELQRQQQATEAQLAGLRSQVEGGERARREAEQVRQELAQLQARKAAVESEMQAEQQKLASIRAERDVLQAAVDQLRQQQLADMAKKAQIATRLKEVDFGRYYALVIGNNEYKEWPKLKTAVNDARDIAEILEKKYGFRVKLIQNGTRSQILNAMEDYVDELGPRDNLLVYYAGHGIIDKGFGYWVPVDGDAFTAGKTLRTQNMVKHEDVISTLQKLKAKQVMLIADSCFSGGLTQAIGPVGGAAQPEQQVAQVLPQLASARGIRVVDVDDGGVAVSKIQGAVVRAEKSEELIAMEHWASRNARVVLTSGGFEPVIDQAKPNDPHSVFAQALLDALKKNGGLLKSIELTTAIQDRVVAEGGKLALRRGRGDVTSQTPSSNYILGYNGEFLFVAKN